MDPEPSPKPILLTSTLGWPMHQSAGALIERDGKFLMLRRKHPPPGLAGPAGHVDVGECPKMAVVRECEEEVKVGDVRITETLVDGEERHGNYCRRVGVHQWYLYRCVIPDDVEPKFDPEETNGGGWFTPEQLAQENLEAIWRVWLERFGIIPRRPRVAICGSMRFAGQMEHAAKMLTEAGWLVEYPAPAPAGQSRLEIMRRHLWHIAAADVVLLWNANGNYVGHSALSEASFAAAWAQKPVFALCSVPKFGGHEELPAVIAGTLGNDFMRLPKPHWLGE